MTQALGEACLHELFEVRAREHPDAVALVHGTAELTYGELDRRATALAWRLRELGVGPEHRVGLCVARTPELVIAILGILKAGGAYVPLDPRHPIDRLRYMLEAAGAEIAVGSARPDLAPVVRHLLDVSGPPAAGPLISGVRAANAAVVIFTSGSHGRPKGVCLEHRTLVNHIRFRGTAFPDDAFRGMLAAASVTFDASIAELFAPLSRGGRVFLADTAIDLAELPRRDEVIAVDIVPSVIEQLLAAGAVPRSLRYVVVAGERATSDLVHRIYALGHVAAVYDEYGPSEATVSVTQALRGRDLDSPETIGRPIAGARIYVLDDHGVRVPEGAVGELHIGGPVLARGYERQPGLTADRFGPDPFSPVPGARMYRTGDLARWRPDGELEFLGRVDDQIKIRGLRIELGEIETALAAHPAIRHCAVIARETRRGIKQIVAYVVGADADAAELRGWLSARLPDYMIPVAFLALDDLPLLTSGKLDRRALPSPPETTAYIEPRTATEHRIAALWGEVLGVAQPGVTDDFLELGGDSLLALRIAARLRGALGVDVRGEAILAARTIEALARALPAGATEPLVPIPRDGPLALAPAQLRLWFLHRLDPANPAYHVPGAHRLRGPLDPEALRRAFEQLIARHEALRTVFPAHDGVPAQRVLAPGRFELPVEDVGQAELAPRAVAALVAPFALETGPLLRARLLRLAPDDHVLLFELHHIVSDGWSIDVLWRELAVLYTGGTLAPLPIQYADYAAWARRAPPGDAVAYWKRRLADAPADLALPYRGPRPAHARARGSRVCALLEPSVETALRELARRHGATLFMVLVAALRALIARYTNQRDLCLGIAIANRSHPELEELIGFFVNTLVLRGEVRPGDRFADLVERERAGALEAFAHADAPFEQVVDALGLERTPDRVPLLQVVCVDHGAVAYEGALPGIATTPVALGIEPVSFELVLNTREIAGRREIALTYDVDLFERSTIEALVARYVQLLGVIAAQPEVPLASIELMTAGERRALIDDPARGVAWESAGPTIAERIEDRMRATPEATALIAPRGETTYRELDAHSGAVAARLLELGVGPDQTVAVLAERGPAQIAGVVGVLRAGGAFVPIKPDLPAERIAWLLDDSAAVAVLCDGPPPAAVGARPVVRLDQHDQLLSSELHVRPEVPLDALAYLIYTSGSTGRPKGVMISRRSFDAQLRWTQRTLPLAPDDRVLQLSSTMFDVSLLEIFAPLAAGAAIVLPAPGAELEPRELGRFAAQAGATVAHLVPSLARAITEVCGDAPWATLRSLFLAGEALPVDLVRSAGAVFPNAELHNQYGPTEATIIASTWRCRPGDERVPIGVSVGDTTLYVLDDAQRPVPPGALGELWIGGVQVARGYLARPALTAERFTPDPYARRAGARMYRTGDLVRQSVDGVIDYLGRTDFQVKVRGFRIELGEIEAALHAHPSVKATAVVARDDRASGKVLAAYVVAGAPVEPAELRAMLAARLPEYMVPAVFVMLDELPVTANGKLDRGALPAPRFASEAYAAPRTPTEELVARIWSELLELEAPGVHDNFFARGGHSLLVMRLVARIGAATGIELAARAVFEHPTIAGQAARLDAARAMANGDDTTERELAAEVAALDDAAVEARLAEWRTVDLAVAERGGRPELVARLVAQHRIDARPSLPLARGSSMTAPATYAQRLQWDFHHRGNHPSLSNLATAYAVRGALEPAAAVRAVAQLIERQAALRTTFALRDGRLIQTVNPTGPSLAITEARSEAEARARFALISQPLDLEREVFRAELVRLAPDHHLLLVAPHHIVLDGFSWDVLEHDLSVLLRAAASGAPADLPPLAFTYRDFCAWQTSLEDRPIGRRQLAFWARAVADYPGLGMPGDAGDAPRGSQGLALDTYAEGEVPIAITGDDWRAVEQACARLACTPYTVLATAYLLLLVRWSGRTDACLLSGNVHRNRPGSEAVIGNFVTPYPLRVRFDERATLEEAVARCRESVIAHREQAHVAPSSTRAAWPEWSRYNLNYLIDPGDPAAGDLGGATLERLRWLALTRRTPSELALYVRQFPGALRGGLAYNAERFSPALAARIGARIGELVRAISTSPTARIDDLPRAP